MDSRFMEAIVEALADRNVATTRFEFDYMAERRTAGSRRPPPRAERLVPEYRAAVEQIASANGGRRKLLIGGKSLGGRVASLVADEFFAAGRIAGCVCLGYPFHPPKKPQSSRTAHLVHSICPTLILQGERDPFGNREEASRYQFSDTIRVQFLADGDHDWRPRVASGLTHADNIGNAAREVAEFAARTLD